MQFLSFRNGGRNGLAVRENVAGFFGLLEGDPSYPGPLDGLVARSASDRHAAGQTLLAGAEIDPASVEVLPPLAFPGKIICVGLNYRAHALESGMQLPEYPTLFARFPSNLIGGNTPIVRPPESDKLDYEGELVAVIGKASRRIAEADALNHVMGYSIFNNSNGLPRRRERRGAGRGASAQTLQAMDHSGSGREETVQGTTRCRQRAATSPRTSSGGERPAGSVPQAGLPAGLRGSSWRWQSPSPRRFMPRHRRRRETARPGRQA